jgi:hypothetical protein
MSTASTSSPAPNRKVFIRDGEAYSSLTSDHLPEIPQPPLSYDDADCPSLASCQKPRWVDPRFYSLAYTPRHPRFDKPFDALKFSRLIPIEELHHNARTTMYQTPSMLRQALEQLELELVQISTILSQHITLFGLDFRNIPRPESYGYRRLHVQRKYARRAVEQTRDGFVIFMAWISYLITINNGVLVEGVNGKPDFRVWEDMLCKGGIPQDRVQELKNSEINMFGPSYPRAGVIVRYNNYAFHKTMKLCIKNHIPVWVWWGNGSEPWRPEAPVKDHMPTPEEVRRAGEIAAADAAAARENAHWNDIAAQSWAAISAPLTPAPLTAEDVSVPKLPKPLVGSRQRHGETPAQFIERMAEDRVRRMATEKAIDKQRRESREEAQRTHPFPGRSSNAPLVYHWEEDPESGFRLRTQVSRRAVDQLWDRYSDKQRIYDWYHNQWDICTEFDPDAEYPDAGSDYDDDTMDNVYMSDISESHPHSSSSLPVSHSPPNSMQAASSTLPLVSSPTALRDEPDSEDTVFSVVFSGGLIDLLYERYGFLNPGLNPITIYTSNIDWRNTRSILGLASPDAPAVQAVLSVDNLHNSHVQQAISHFIQCLLDPDKTMPAALSDIHPDSPEPVAHNPHLRIFKRKTKLTNDTSEVDTYFIQSADANGMEVMLRDPATVLECYRQFHGLHDIVFFLFMSGNPFYTFLPQSFILQPPPARMRSSPTLGYYPKDYKPGLREYRYYEELRREFCNLPRARAAMMRGSIIWRLALESLGIPAEEIVRNGPSEEVFTHGTSLRHSPTSSVLWDDELSEGEKDLICGVYHVFTGEY